MINYILYRIGQFIALSFPRRIGYKIAIFFSDLHYLFAFKDKRAVRDNLKAVFPHKSDREICRLRLAMFRNFAKHIVDFFRFSKIDREFIEKNIKTENMHYLDEALKKKKGVITLTAHLGNWELGGAVIGTLGYPFWVVALPHKHKKVDDFFNRQRLSKGVHVLALGKSGRGCLRALKENKILGLVGDRDFNESGVIVDFFGKPTIFPEGPAVFSLHIGSVILPGFMIRNKDDNFTFRFEKPIEFHPTGKTGEDTKALVSTYIKVIESYVRKYPDQWYMFRRFWLQ
ncbi:MAG: lysophospholipid acyltransferase family protein [Candidatus Omnitrophica bacterium]|nr:lysophospholipid acyltransferase family protein [Candidatus Omnitrophota bacterium]